MSRHQPAPSTERVAAIRTARANLGLDFKAARRLGGGRSALAAVFTVRFLAGALLRLSQALGPALPLFGLLVKQLNHVLTGADIAWQAEIGGGLVMFHPTGVVIGPECIVGDHCLIQQGVTIGSVGTSIGASSASPVIGANVFLGPGCRILGPVCVGAGAVVGANAVVTRSVPPGAIAVGIPARWHGTTEASGT